MNYNILELILSTVNDFEKLVMLTRVCKSWMVIIRENQCIWKDVYVENDDVYDDHLIYPIKINIIPTALMTTMK